MAYINGWKYTNEETANEALQLIDSNKGFPVAGGFTQHYTGFESYKLGEVEFFAILFDESLISLLGASHEIEINNNENPFEI